MAVKITSAQKKAMYEARYVGRVIELTEAIEDPYTPKPAGSRFHVTSVDDCYQLHGYWEDGGSMAVNVELDHFKVAE